MEFNTHILLFLVVIVTHSISLATGQSVNIFLSGRSGAYPSGEDATIVCNVTNYNAATMVLSLARTQSGLTTTLVYNEAVTVAAPDNVNYIGSFAQSNGVATWKITRITSVTIADAGMYTCTLILSATNQALSSASLNLLIQYVPIPMCSIQGGATDNYEYRVGDQVTLLCSSEVGIPTASLVWSVSESAPDLPSRDSTSGTDFIATSVTIEITQLHNLATYSCLAYSSAGNTNICQLGPLQVIDTPLPTTLPTTQIKTTISPVTDRIVPSISTNMITTSSNSSPKVSPNTGLSSSAIAAICVIFILLIIAIVLGVYLFRTNRCDSLLSKKSTTREQTNAHDGVKINNAAGASLDTEHAYYNTAQDTATVEHKADPSGAALYAVVEKPKSVRYPEANGKVPNNNQNDNSKASSNDKKHSEPVVYSNVNEMSVTESPKRERSTTTTAIPCTDDSTIDATTLAIPEQSGGMSDSNELPVYAKVNKTVRIKNKDSEESLPSADNEEIEDHSPTQDLNVEGLLYADLNLIRQPDRKTDTIISTDEATIYADIGGLTSQD